MLLKWSLSLTIILSQVNRYVSTFNVEGVDGPPGHAAQDTVPISKSAAEQIESLTEMTLPGNT